MSKEQNLRRYLDIPGEKSLVYTFKFNMDLPPPVPQPKTMYIPLDPERYIRPKLTLLHVKRKPTIMTDISLSIPVDEVNMRPELYNPPPDAKFELSDKDRELIDEKVAKKTKRTPKKVDATNGTAKEASVADKRKSSAEALNATNKAKPTSGAPQKKVEAASQAKKKEDIKKLSIDEYVRRTFDVAKSYSVGSAHPSKDGVLCQEVFDIIPDIRNILTDLYVMKTEVSTDTLKSKQNLLKFDTDIDQKPILAVYLNKPLSEVVAESQREKKPEKKKSGDEEEGIEEEGEKEENPEENATTLDLNDPLLKKVENFEHIGNYMYSQPKPAKDLLLNLDKENGAAYIYQPHPIVLKKKKVLFMNKTVYKDEEGEEEKKPKEKKKTVKLIKRDHDKDELLLRKRKFKELHLENTPFYQDTNRDIDNFKEEDEEELEQIKKKFVEEEEEEPVEEEPIEEEQFEEERDVDREQEEENVEEEEDNYEERVNIPRRDEEEEEEVLKSEDENKGAVEEEEEHGAQEKAKVEDKKSESADSAKELADFFEGESDDDDD